MPKVLIDGKSETEFLQKRCRILLNVSVEDHARPVMLLPARRDHWTKGRGEGKERGQGGAP